MDTSTPASVTSPGLSARALRRLVRDPRALLGLLVLAALLLCAAFAPQLAPGDPIEQDLLHMLEAPSASYLLGTDELGRDILSRLIYGARISLYVGIVSVLISLLGGTTLGLIAGYFRGRTDGLIMRLMDVILAFPSLLLALAIAAALGKNLTNAMLAIGFVGIPGFARLVRGQVLSIRERDFITASRALGQTDYLIIIRHILPNAAPPLVVQVSLSLAFAVLTEASLSFLGLGVAPPTPSWGSMLSMARGYMDTAPWLSMGPGVAIFILVLGFNLLGDGIRDSFDPTIRR